MKVIKQNEQKKKRKGGRELLKHGSYCIKNDKSKEEVLLYGQGMME